MNQKKFSISMIVGLVCVLVVVVGMVKAISGPVLDIPVFSIVLGEAEVNEARNELMVIADEFDKLVADADETEISELENATGMKVEKISKMIRSFSLNNLIKVCNINAPELDMDFDNELLEMFTLIRNIIMIYALVVALFSLLGALLKKKVFTIVAMVISIPFFVFLAGVIFLVLFFAFSIVHIVLLSKEKAAATAPAPFAQM